MTEKTNTDAVSKEDEYNGKQGAFACASDGGHQLGLTKREYFAALAMQGIVGKVYHQSRLDKERIAESSVEIADILLEKLAKPKRF